MYACDAVKFIGVGKDGLTEEGEWTAYCDPDDHEGPVPRFIFYGRGCGCCQEKAPLTIKKALEIKEQLRKTMLWLDHALSDMRNYGEYHEGGGGDE